MDTSIVSLQGYTAAQVANESVQKLLSGMLKYYYFDFLIDQVLFIVLNIFQNIIQSGYLFQK